MPFSVAYGSYALPTGKQSLTVQFSQGDHTNTPEGDANAAYSKMIITSPVGHRVIAVFSTNGKLAHTEFQNVEPVKEQPEEVKEPEWNTHGEDQQEPPAKKLVDEKEPAY